MGGGRIYGRGGGHLEVGGDEKKCDSNIEFSIGGGASERYD